MIFTSTEFIPFYRIFGAKIPSPFTTDGIHITPSCNKSFANFLSSISIRKPSIYSPFSLPYPSFHLYLEYLSSPSSKLSSLPRHTPQTTILSFTPPTPTYRSHTNTTPPPPHLSNTPTQPPITSLSQLPPHLHRQLPTRIRWRRRSWNMTMRMSWNWPQGSITEQRLSLGTSMYQLFKPLLLNSIKK